MRPGSTRSTPTPSGSTSALSDPANPFSACLLAQYAPVYGKGSTPKPDDTNTTVPCRRSSIAGRNALVQCTAPKKLTSSTARIRSRERSTMGAQWPMPALLTTMSGVPASRLTRSASAATASGSVTSQGTTSAGRPPPARETSSAAARSRDSERETRTIRAPAPASAAAVARPMPEEAPVTTATRPAREAFTRRGRPAFCSPAPGPTGSPRSRRSRRPAAPRRRWTARRRLRPLPTRSCP